jgi:hypothetical protein
MFYVLKVFFTRNNGYTFKLEIPIHLATSEDDIINILDNNIYLLMLSCSMKYIHLYNEIIFNCGY